MPVSLPGELTELVLRCADGTRDHHWVCDAAFAARTWHRLLRVAALVSRGWQAVATRLLAETVVVRSSAELAALERAIERGWIRGEHVCTLILDDVHVEREEARMLARWQLGGSQTAPSPEDLSIGDLQLQLAPTLVAAFSERLQRIVVGMGKLEVVQTVLARSWPGSARRHLRTLHIDTTAPEADEIDWDASWPEVPESVEDLRIRVFSTCGYKTMPPMPHQLVRLRRLTIGSARSPVDFHPSMLTAPAHNLVRLDVVIGLMLAETPGTLFHIPGTGVVATPNLRHVRVGLEEDGLLGLAEADLLGQLPSSVVWLDYVAVGLEGAHYEDLPEDPRDRPAPFAHALRDSLAQLSSSSHLRRITLNLAALDRNVIAAYRASEAMVELVSACQDRGIEFSIDLTDSGMQCDAY